MGKYTCVSINAYILGTTCFTKNLFKAWAKCYQFRIVIEKDLLFVSMKLAYKHALRVGFNLNCLQAFS